MPTLTITQAATGVPPEGPHPKAVMRAENGRELVLPYAPRGTTLGGYAPPLDQLDRPGRAPLVQRNGDGLLTCGLSLTLARPDHQQSVEDYIAALAAIAESGQRVTLLNMSPQERGPWYINALSVAGELRQHGTNAITRATVTLDLLEAPPIPTGPVAGGGTSGGKAGSKIPKTYVVVKGDTLRKIADRFYGTPSAWRYIAATNQIKDPDKLKVGRTLRLPPARPSYPGPGETFFVQVY
jgi:LysM repeat protein